MKTISILGVPIHYLTKDQALEVIERFIGSGKPHQVTTVNPEFILEARRNKEFMSVLSEADLSLADGAGIAWAARYLEDPLPERIPGADFVLDIARQAQNRDWKFYLLGGSESIALRAAEELNRIFPKLLIVGAESGLNYDPNDRSKKQLETIDSLIKRINLTNPDVLLVAFGAPKQDIFITRHKYQLKVPVMIGVGGTFDYLAGKIERAPTWFRRFSLEWLWRLVREPKRLGRIWQAVIIFPYLVIRSAKN